MDEDFIFQVTEEELAQFPEEEEQEERSKSPIDPVQKKEEEENTVQKEKSKYPFPVGLETNPGCMLPAEMATVADRTRNRDSRSWTRRRRQCRRYSKWQENEEKMWTAQHPQN